MTDFFIDPSGDVLTADGAGDYLIVGTGTVLTFPTLRGRSWSTHKKSGFSTRISQQQDGSEIRSANYPYPRWEFDLAFNVLPDTPNAPAGDLRTIMGFFLACQGAFANFLYRDPSDYQVRGGFIALTDGTTLQWPFARQLTPGSLVEPVGQVDGSAVATFAPGGVITGGDSITLTMPPVYVGGSMPELPPETGDGPFFVTASAGGALPAGLAALTPYWAINVGGDTIQLAVSRANALAATPVTLTSAGAGTFALTKGYALYLNGAPVSPSAFSLSGANQIVFASAPATGQTLTADFDFWFVCRFLEDMQDYENFMFKLWKLGKCDFVAPPP